MRPLLIYPTFNRLGTTVKSLTAILEDDSDFEMVIVDNCSKDKTREYLESLTDPRIREIRFFDTNIGEVQAVNWALTLRAKDQDFMLIEADACIQTKGFVKKFQRVIEVFGVDQVHARVAINHDSVEFDAREDTGFLRCHVYGACYYMTARLINKLGFYCERINYGDVDFNRRIEILGHISGYARDVEVAILQPDDADGNSRFGWNCDTCYKMQNVCRWENRRCLDYYAKLNRQQWAETSQRTPFAPVAHTEMYRSTIHLSGIEKNSDEMFYRNFFQGNYEKVLKEKGLA